MIKRVGSQGNSNVNCNWVELHRCQTWKRFWIQDGSIDRIDRELLDLRSTPYPQHLEQCLMHSWP